MAMNFTAANRAMTPNIVEAKLRDAEIRNQLRQAEQARRLSYLGAGSSLASKVPMSKWQDFGYAVTGQSPAMVGGASTAGGATTGAEAAMSSTVADPISGAVASGVPESAAGAELLGAASSSAPSATLGAEAAGAAEAAMAAEAAGGAGGAAAGGTGVGSALAALGPVGWLSLLGFGLAATDALG